MESVATNGSVSCAGCRKEFVETELFVCKNCDLVVCGLCFCRNHTHGASLEMESFADKKKRDGLKKEIRREWENLGKIEEVVDGLQQLEHIANRAKEIREKLADTQHTNSIANQEVLLDSYVAGGGSCDRAMASIDGFKASVRETYDAAMNLLLETKEATDELWDDMKAIPMKGDANSMRLGATKAIPIKQEASSGSKVVLLVGGVDENNKFTRSITSHFLPLHSSASAESGMHPTSACGNDGSLPSVPDAPMDIVVAGLGRSSHMMNGKLYAFGCKGRGGQIWSPLCFDLNKQEWRIGPGLPHRCVPYGGFSSGVLGDKLYVSVKGSYHCITDELGSWCRMPETSSGDCSLVVANDRLYAVGLYSSDGVGIAIYYYDPQKTTWHDCTHCPIDVRSAYCLGIVGSGSWIHIFVCDRHCKTRKWIKYCPAENRWSSVSQMNVPRVEFSAAADGDNVVAVGGWRLNEDGTRGEILRSIEYYDGNTDKWTLIDDMLTEPLLELPNVVILQD